MTADPTQPLHIGNATVTLFGTPSDPTKPPDLGPATFTEPGTEPRLIAVLVDDHAVKAADDNTASATLASPVVGVATLDRPGEAALQPVQVVIPVTLEPQGNGACTATQLFQTPHANATCVAGCCLHDACSCQRGYMGSRCEYELRCALVQWGHSTFDGRACDTGPHELDDRLVCTCNQLGAVAALRFRLTPPNNADGVKHVARVLPLLSLPPQSWLCPLLLGLLAAAFALATWCDVRTLYVSSDSPRLLRWLRPQQHSTLLRELRIIFFATLLTRSSLLRVLFAYPGHTVYSRAQLVLVLANSIVINALVVALFLQRDAEICSAIAALIVSFSSVAAGMVASGCRLIFRWSNFVKGSDARARYYANKTTRLQAWADPQAIHNAPHSRPVTSARVRARVVDSSSKLPPSVETPPPSLMATINECARSPLAGKHGELHDVELSKALSTLLRHRAVEAGLLLDSQGWASLAEALRAVNARENALTYTEADVCDMVRLNNTQRFELREARHGTQIRAKGGHSMRLPGLLASLTRRSHAPGRPPRVRLPTRAAPLDSATQVSTDAAPAFRGIVSFGELFSRRVSTRSDCAPSRRLTGQRSGGVSAGVSACSPRSFFDGSSRRTDFGLVSTGLSDIMPVGAEVGAPSPALEVRRARSPPPSPPPSRPEDDGATRSSQPSAATAMPGSATTREAQAKLLSSQPPTTTAMLGGATTREEAQAKLLSSQPPTTTAMLGGPTPGGDLKTREEAQAKLLAAAVGSRDELLGALKTRQMEARGARRGRPTLVVSPHDLARESSTMATAIGLCLRTHAGDAAFVPATHIGLRSTSGALRVTLDMKQLPSGLGRLAVEQVVPQWERAPRLPLVHCGWRSLIAWSVNWCCLCGACVWLLLIFLSLHLLPEQLEAHSLSMDEWHEAFRLAFAMSLLTAFLLVDGVKVCLLSLMSHPRIEARLRRLRRGKLVRKPLRRLHKLLDILL